MYKYIDLLKEDIPSTNGTNEILKSIYHQIPFFSCPNLFNSDNLQKDISRYLYCEDTKTPPYPGSYGEIPNMWKEKHFLIKQALSILYQDKREQIKQKHGK